MNSTQSVDKINLFSLYVYTQKRKNLFSSNDCIQKKILVKWLYRNKKKYAYKINIMLNDYISN